MYIKQSTKTNTRKVNDYVEGKFFCLLQAFAAATSYFPRGIIDMLTKLQLSHQGRLHSGIGKEL
jgi:hypothetical protein